MYAGSCNPFGPSYDFRSKGGIDIGVNSFWVGFNGTTSQMWGAGGIVWYSTDDAEYGWRDDKSSGSLAITLLADNVPAQIDVEPWDKYNRVYPDAAGVVKVGLLSSSIANGEQSDFDANQVDTASLKFGPTEASVLGIYADVDINGDGNPDLMTSFAMPDTGIVCADTEVTLSGATNSGKTFSATDEIQTEDCVVSGCHP